VHQGVVLTRVQAEPYVCHQTAVLHRHLLFEGGHGVQMRSVEILDLLSQQV